ncbi:histidine phosphatase superfamily [Cladorrhinum samala]|uniref:Histidine phosphatase superfamily n=1 Tax=Cladorrhinum samala TaxID=585594 RepID=A0AAV9HYM5_9PEZI|nr:histidine phosphatase superfamily [Cladorrhinum samala]
MRDPAASFLAVLALIVPGSSAQATNTKVERVWSSVSWVHYGDRTPFVSATNPATLTPLGAHRLLNQGGAVRDRYLWRTRVGPDENGDDIAPIAGISRNAIDNSQLNILSTTDSYVVGSALAFLQGLYPPVTQAFPNATGGIEAASLSNGTVMNYPLGGYQYPNVRTFSRANDPDSIWLQGHAHCPEYLHSMLYPANDSYAASINEANLDFYRGLYNRTFKGAFALSSTNFFNAYNLYDYANYHYTHKNNNNDDDDDDDDNNSLGLDMGEMLRLRALASVEQRWRNGNLTVSGSTPGDRIRAISGRTLAAKVMSFFMDNIRSGGQVSKLNLVFTSFEPFLAFFSLAGLTAGPSYQLFNPLPYPGATMLFELFSLHDEDDSSFPGMANLSVRFLYRNGTEEGSRFRVYSIFDNVVAYPDMSFSQFAKYMEGVGVATVRDWCRICDSAAFFCAAADGNGNGGWGSGNDGGGGRGLFGEGRRGGLSPTAAGAVGAVVTLAVTGLVLLVTMLVGGLRFHKAAGAKRGSFFGGGFKGPEKKEDDADVEYAKGGVRHERTGSWELRDGVKKSSGPGLSVNTVGASESVRPVSPVSPVSPASVTGVGATVIARDLAHPAKQADDDNLSVYGQEPVRPREF